MLESVKNNCMDLRWSQSFFYHSCTWHFPLKELVVNVFVRPLHLLKKEKKKKVKRDDGKQQPAGSIGVKIIWIYGSFIKRKIT